MTAKFEAFQRVAVSAIAALLLATVFVGSAVVPAEAAIVVAPVL